MERGICPTAVLYFAAKRSFFNILKTLLVNKGTNVTRFWVMRNTHTTLTMKKMMYGVR